MVIQSIKVLNDRGRNESNHMKVTGEEREAVRETGTARWFAWSSRGSSFGVVHGFAARGRDRGGVVRSKPEVCHGERRRGQKGEQEHIK